MTIARRPIAAIEQVDGLQGALDGKEAALGNPASSGKVLASTTAGVRSWVPNGSEVLSSVTALSTNHPATWSADAATDTLTSSAAHGLAVNTPIAFGAGTGALPGGLSPEPEYYYVIEVPTTTTLKVSLTYGGTAVDITDAGTAGWVVKNLPLAGADNGVRVDGFSLNAATEIDLFYRCSYAATGSLAGYLSISFPLTVACYGSDSTLAQAKWYVPHLVIRPTKKYNICYLKAKIRVLATGVAQMTFESGGTSSGVPTYASDVTNFSGADGALLYYTGDITSIRIHMNSGYVLSGATCVVVRRP